MAEKAGVRDGFTVARRPSFRKTLREQDSSLPPEYLDALEQKRKQLDESIHKYIASKEREYKNYEKELRQQAKNAAGATGCAATPALPTGGANGNGLLTSMKRRTSSESTVSATSPFLAPQQHSAVDTLLASGVRRQPVSQAIDEGGGAERPGTANLKDRRASAEREKEFVGLFTPPYLPLIDHKDERTLKRTESAPSAVETSSRATDADESASLPKADSETAMYAKYKRPVHLQLAKRTSSSGSSADGKLASAMKSPQQSLQRPKRKRVSLAVGDSIVAPSDNVPVTMKYSSTPSHSRTRSPENEVPLSQAGATASLDFAKQPHNIIAEQSALAGLAAINTSGPSATSEASTNASPTSRTSIDPDGDLFDLEEESEGIAQTASGFDSAIESDEDAMPGITGRIDAGGEPVERNDLPLPSPRVRISGSAGYDPEAGSIPESAAESRPALDGDEGKAVHLEFGPSSSGFSSSSSRQPTSPGFRRPTVESDPVFRGSDYFQEEKKAAEEEIYGSSFSRPPTKGSFTGGSLGESFMLKHAEEMMRTRMAKNEQAAR
ncbi:hypothetical protein LTR15_002585 [Elasticomyces elasticus]|nr:hypothetical protein LTR15_002585 [Elasticomyces elasticus]